MIRPSHTTFALALAISIASLAQAKITLELDYSLDANGFFSTGTANGLAARAALSAAADAYNDRFLDTLAAVTVGSPNSYTISIRNPATGVSGFQTAGINIAANTIKVYAGGRDEPGTTLGIGGPAGYSASGTQAFLDNLKGRGNSGALASPPTDFAPFAGSIGFDSGTNWNFSVAALPSGAQADFLSVSLHELGHLLGFGTATSFTSTYTTGLQFTGPKSKALNGGANVPLENTGHLLSSLTSTVTGTDSQQPAMTPSIAFGQRKKFTRLDWAGLDDLGWDLAKPGDANADGQIEFADLLNVAQHYGATAGQTWSEGDFNYDTGVGFDDLLALAQNYGTGGPLLTAAQLDELSTAGGLGFAGDWAAQSLVPEPTFATIAAASTLCISRRRRK